MGRERYTPEQQAFYRAYLSSPAWRDKKTARIAKAGGRCEFAILKIGGGEDRCPRTRYLCVHHKTYERLGAEYDSDLAVYCWSCHMLEHLLWQRCWACGEPCLQNDVQGQTWLQAVLATLEIDLDNGPINWRRLPNKERLLDQVPTYCPRCLHLVHKDGEP